MMLLQFIGLSLLTFSMFTAGFAIIFRRVGYVLAVIDSISYEDAEGKKNHVVGKLPKLAFSFAQNQVGSISQQKAALAKMFVSEIEKVLPEHVLANGQASFAIRYWHSSYKIFLPLYSKLLANHESEGIVRVSFAQNGVPEITASFGPPRRSKTYKVTVPEVPKLPVLRVILAEVKGQGKEMNIGEPVAEQLPTRVPTGEEFSGKPPIELISALSDIYDIRRRSDLDGGRTLEFDKNAKWSLADISWKRALWFYCIQSILSLFTIVYLNIPI